MIMQCPSQQLRVALVASSLAQAGAEKQFAYAARAWRNSGAEVVVVYLGTEDYYESALRQHDLPVVSLASAGKPWRALWRLIGVLRRFRPDIVIASQFGDLVHAGMSGRLLHRPVIVGAVRSDGLWERNTYRWRFPFMLRLSHALVACSRFAKENLAKVGIDPGRIFILPNAIDLSDFDQRARRPVEFPFPGSRVVAAAVGRLNQGKRFDRFLDALALARESVPALAGLIIGPDDGERARLEQKAFRLGLSPRHLVFLGKSPEVPALLNRCHSLMVTSDFEGFPNVILEAMAARLPVITLRVGEAEQAVVDNITGFVIDPPNRETLAKRLVQLACSPKISVELGEAGRDRVEQVYDFSLLGERLGSLYWQIAMQVKRPSLLPKLQRLKTRTHQSTALEFATPATEMA